MTTDQKVDGGVPRTGIELAHRHNVLLNEGKKYIKAWYKAC
jgi:hypothetical protein